MIALFGELKSLFTLMPFIFRLAADIARPCYYLCDFYHHNELHDFNAKGGDKKIWLAPLSILKSCNAHLAVDYTAYIMVTCQHWLLKAVIDVCSAKLDQKGENDGYFSWQRSKSLEWCIMVPSECRASVLRLCSEAVRIRWRLECHIQSLEKSFQ